MSLEWMPTVGVARLHVPSARDSLWRLPVPRKQIVKLIDRVDAGARPASRAAMPPRPTVLLGLLTPLFPAQFAQFVGMSATPTRCLVQRADVVISSPFQARIPPAQAASRPRLFLPPLMLTEDEAEAALPGLRYVDQRGGDIATKAVANAHARIPAVQPRKGRLPRLCR